MVIFTVIQFEVDPKISVFFAVCTVTSLLFLFVFLKLSRRIHSRQIPIKKPRNKTGESMSYFLTYLVAFMRFDLTRWDGRIALLLVFSVLGLIYVKSELILTNPTLMIFGYRLYSCENRDGGELIVLTKRRDFESSSKPRLHVVATEFAVESM